jgi:hypothetical protein
MTKRSLNRRGLPTVLFQLTSRLLHTAQNSGNNDNDSSNNGDDGGDNDNNYVVDQRRFAYRMTRCDLYFVGA